VGEQGSEGLPREFVDAVTRALDREAASGTRPIAEAFEVREQILRVTHAVVHAWREHDVTTDEAVKMLEYLVANLA
jgi:hypothetical protein